MSNSQAFVDAYNRLDDALRRRVDAESTLSFSAVVKAAFPRHADLDLRQDLQEYADLRNAIVHDHRSPRLIASVHENALAAFLDLVESVINPPKVIPRFQRHLRVFRNDEPLSEALRLMRAEDFSQVVVLTDGVYGLLTTEAIARWIEHEVENDDAIIDQHIPVSIAYGFERTGSSGTVARVATVADVRDLFSKLPKSGGGRLQGVLITENGRATEKPLGLITAWDLATASAP